MKRFLLLVMVFSLLVGCSPGNLDYVKDNAAERWKGLGFEVVGYDGFMWGFWGFNSYGGANVWYVLRRIPDNGLTYGGYLQRWGDEIHMYHIQAYDAIRPR